MAKSFDALVTSISRKGENALSNLNSRFADHVELLTKAIDSSFLSLKENLLSSMKSGFDEICSDIITPTITDMRDRYADLVRNQNDLSARIDELFISVNDAASFTTKSQPQLTDYNLNGQLDSSQHSDTDAALSFILPNDFPPVPTSLHSELIAAETSIINERTNVIISEHSSSPSQLLTLDPAACDLNNDRSLPVVNNVPINLPAIDKRKKPSRKNVKKVIKKKSISTATS